MSDTPNDAGIADPRPAPDGPRGAAGVTSGGAPVRIAGVALTVRDMDAVGRFYRDVIGLRVIEDGATRKALGVGETTLVELRAGSSARRDDPRSAGLFHTAFLLPDRAHLADWLLHAAEAGVRLEGASDHRVSEALYLSDPEGNGIEVYVDRPSEAWPKRDGMIEMATLPLDLQELAATSTGRWSGAPQGAIVGHVHLRVGDLAASEGFYRGTLGLELACRYPGADFFGSGGYHHHIAGNVWRSRGASTRDPGTTGLAEVRLLADAGAFDGVRSRLDPRQAAEGSARLALRDPWGTSIVVERA